VTEIVDENTDACYVLGGGLYIDPVIPPYQVRAFVGPDGDAALLRRADARFEPPGGIDYYTRLDPHSARMGIGDSVVFGFRAQAFVTRASVVPVRGISRGAPKVAGVYEVTGRKVA
jgi:predicted amino acid racemase